jgi:chromate reductase
MTSPEAYIHYSPAVFADSGEVVNDETAAYLRSYMAEFRDYVERVLTVIPRARDREPVG